MKSPNVKRFAVYARNSTTNQKGNTSESEQQVRAKAFGENLGYRYFGSFVDNVSGTKLAEERLESAKLLEAIRDKKIDGVIVSKVDRAGRELSVIKDLVRKVIEAGGFFGLVEANKIYKDFDDFTDDNYFGMIVADWERARIETRTKRGKKRAILAGGMVGVGYTGLRFAERFVNYEGFSTKIKILVKDEETSWIVRRIFDRFFEGANLFVIARELNAKKQLSRRGKEWTARSVAVILRNHKIYAGLPFEREYTSLKITQTYSIEGTIISLEESLRAETLLNQMGRKQEAKPEKPLNRLVVCSSCGGRGLISYNGKRGIFYVCNSYKNAALAKSENRTTKIKGCKRHVGLGVLVKEVQKALEGFSDGLLAEQIKSLQTSYVTRSQELGKVTGELAELEQEENQIRQQLRSILGDDKFKRSLAFIEDDLERVGLKKSELEESRTRLSAETKKISTVLEHLGLSGKLWDMPLLVSYDSSNFVVPDVVLVDTGDKLKVLGEEQATQIAEKVTKAVKGSKVKPHPAIESSLFALTTERFKAKIAELDFTDPSKLNKGLRDLGIEVLVDFKESAKVSLRLAYLPS